MTGPVGWERLDSSLDQLHRTLAEARTTLDRARRTLVPTPADLARLQSDALAGTLGRELYDLAGHVAGGRTRRPPGPP